MTCACVHRDPFSCWSHRYGIPDCADDIVWDGGPCECGCHEWYYDEEDELP